MNSVFDGWLGGNTSVKARATVNRIRVYKNPGLVNPWIVGPLVAPEPFFGGSLYKYAAFQTWRQAMNHANELRAYRPLAVRFDGHDSFFNKISGAPPWTKRLAEDS